MAKQADFWIVVGLFTILWLLEAPSHWFVIIPAYVGLATYYKTHNKIAQLNGFRSYIHVDPIMGGGVTILEASVTNIGIPLSGPSVCLRGNFGGTNMSVPLSRNDNRFDRPIEKGESVLFHVVFDDKNFCSTMIRHLLHPYPSNLRLILYSDNKEVSSLYITRWRTTRKLWNQCVSILHRTLSNFGLIIDRSRFFYKFQMSDQWMGFQRNIDFQQKEKDRCIAN